MPNALDTRFQESMNRSIHSAAHFCSLESRLVPGLFTHFLKHFSVIVYRRRREMMNIGSGVE